MTKSYDRKTIAGCAIIGKNLEKIRKSRNETIETVAGAIKMKPALLTKLEAGNYPDCPVTYLFRLQDYYNITEDEIFSNNKTKRTAKKTVAKKKSSKTKPKS